MKNTLKNFYNIDANTFIKYSNKVYKVKNDEEEYCLKNVTLKNIIVQRRESAPKQNVSLFAVQGLNIENVCCK